MVRHLKNWQDEGKLKEWQSWVLESDVVRKITAPGMGGAIDLESDVSPFVSDQDTNAEDGNILKAQTEIFLGQKLNLEGWHEVDESVRKHLPKLTVMSSSNPLFPDNVLHNTNVLSMLDNFVYEDKSQVGGFGYLKNAHCSYFVVGWHSRPGDDPFQQDTQIDFGSHISKFMLKLTPTLKDKSNLEISLDTTRCLVHGAIYDVQYDFAYKPSETKPVQGQPLQGQTAKGQPAKGQPAQGGIRSLANEAAINFTDQVPMEPLSVGTTPLDGILTFLEAHKTDVDHIFGAGASSLAESLMDISQLLYATGDDYDSRVQAQDLIAQQNFSKTDGGNLWCFSKTTTPGKSAQWPTADEEALLVRLNNLQTRLDVANRQVASFRWELFAEWWKYVSKYVPSGEQKDVDTAFKPRIHDLKKSIGNVNDLVTSLTQDIEKLNDPSFCKMTTRDPFHTRVDPTLCIAGLASGWPGDWQDALAVNLDLELEDDGDKALKMVWNGLMPVPSDHGLDKTATKILAACLKNSDTKNGSDGKPNITGYQSWANRNPFIPICIEWEGIYYHVGPFDKKHWDVRLRPSPVGHAHPTLRYVPTEVLASKDENHQDFRSVSGRVLVLPQPVFSLEALVLQVLDSATDDIKLTDQAKSDLRDNIRTIQFISAPLSGLTNHLLTRFEGSHVKPNMRVQGQPLQRLKAAERIDVELDEGALLSVDSESAVTPYGDSFPFGTDQYPGVPFKPVTHGQLIMTKLNIIDKFGQAICMPKILRRPRVAPPVPNTTILPCLSDWLAPDIIDNVDPTVVDKKLNTVFPTTDPVKPGEWPLCQYIQLTPAINQNARINASFLFRSTIDKATQKYSKWQEATDYDPMIWGWIIINYADNGFQFFLGDGTFFREIRRGGAEGTTLGAKWLPYDLPAEPDVPRDAGEAQLSALIEKLRDPQYFQAFSNAINGAIKNMPFPPSDYSGYANAIVGKPLALVNVGWSMELAEPAIKSQNTLGNPAPTPYETLHNYSFPLKLGDIERNYDGVVGYWKPADLPIAKSSDFATMFTYFVTTWANLPVGTVLQLPQHKPPYTVLSGDTLESISAQLNIPIANIKSFNPSIPDATPDDAFQPIAPGNFIQLSPYYTDPLATTDIMADRCAQYKVTSVLIDPYTAIHGYSPILPTKSLTLPPFAVQSAFDKMHAFFHLGPLLLTTDLPDTEAAAKGGLVSFPISGKKGTWNWFQPYAQADANKLDPNYAQMNVQEDQGDKKFEKPPYTFIEGFLQLMGRLDGKQLAGAT